jgi:BirA family biotin operon repressor/biotin-[acetyl-CoA-carboxylase] ligase
LVHQVLTCRTAVTCAGFIEHNGRMPAGRSSAASSQRLDAAALNQRLVVPGRLWTDIRVFPTTGSTNADVIGLAQAGAPDGLVIVAETQTAGRGRQGRSWHSQPGSALMFSLLVRPQPVALTAIGWLPLLAGVATATAVRTVTGVRACLKWPNDVLVDDGKLAGILAERSGPAVVVGIGLNVLGRPDSLPVPTATSLELHGARATDRAELLIEILGQFERCYRRWIETDGGDADACGLRSRYLRLCSTIGKQVNVSLPANRTLSGVATGIDPAGHLLVESGTGPVPVTAGDVIHVR